MKHKNTNSSKKLSSSNNKSSYTSEFSMESVPEKFKVEDLSEKRVKNQPPPTIQKKSSEEYFQLIQEKLLSFNCEYQSHTKLNTNGLVTFKCLQCGQIYENYQIRNLLNLTQGPSCCRKFSKAKENVVPQAVRNEEAFKHAELINVTAEKIENVPKQGLCIFYRCNIHSDKLLRARVRDFLKKKSPPCCSYLKNAVSPIAEAKKILTQFNCEMIEPLSIKGDDPIYYICCKHERKGRTSLSTLKRWTLGPPCCSSGFARP